MVWPLFRNASWKAGLAFSNSSLLNEILDTLVSIILGSCFIMLPGWFDPAFM